MSADNSPSFISLTVELEEGFADGAAVCVLSTSPEVGAATAGNPTQSSGSGDSGTVRSAPAAALSGFAGMQGSIEGEDTNLELPQIPALLGGRGKSMAFPAEMEAFRS